MCVCVMTAGGWGSWVVTSSSWRCRGGEKCGVDGRTTSRVGRDTQTQQTTTCSHVLDTGQVCTQHNGTLIASHSDLWQRRELLTDAELKCVPTSLVFTDTNCCCTFILAAKATRTIDGTSFVVSPAWQLWLVEKQWKQIPPVILSCL